MSRSTAVKKHAKKPGLERYYESGLPIIEQERILFSKAFGARDFRFLGKQRGPGGSVRYMYHLPASNQLTFSYLPLHAYQ